MIDIILYVFANLVLFGFLAFTFKESYLGFLGGVLGFIMCVMMYSDADGLLLMGSTVNPLTGTVIQLTQTIGNYILIPVFLTISCTLMGIARKWG